MAANDLLIGIGFGSLTVSAAYLLPGKNANPTLVDGYPGAASFRNAVVPFHLQYDGEGQRATGWGHCSQSDAPVEDNIRLRTGRDSFQIKSDGDILTMLTHREGEQSTQINHNIGPALLIREFMSSLAAHIRKRAEVTFGALNNARYRIAISVPPSWYGHVQASALGLVDSDLEPRLEVQLVPEPIACLVYFFSKNKKHSLGNGGVVCHCSMDERFTTITQILVTKGDLSLDSRLCAMEVQTFSQTEILNTLRVIIEARIEADFDKTDDDPALLHNKLQEIGENFLKFLPTFDGTKDYKLRLPWKFPDRPEAHIRNNHMLVDASTLREQIFKKLLSPVLASLTQMSRKQGQKLYILCSGVLSECPYVSLCLNQLLSKQGVGEEIEILRAVNGRTSASCGATIFMDPDRRHSQVGTIAPLPDQTEIHLHSTPGSKADILIQRLKSVSVDLLPLGEKTTENCLSYNKAVLLERRIKLLLHEYLKWFGFSPLLLDLFVSIHSLHILLGKQALSADLRKQLEKAIRRKHVSEGTQAEDMMLWFCRIGATSGLLQFLHDTGSSIVEAAPLDAFTRATPVDVAVANVQPSVLDWLLKKGASFESKASDGSTCLHVAIRNFAQLRTPESKSVVELLIPFLSQGSVENHGGNLLNIENDSGSTVLDIALDAGLNVDTLTKAGAKRSSGLRTYQPNLMKAIEADDGPALTKLLDNLRNVDIDLRCPDSTSLLHFAVLNQSFCCVQTLLKYHKELGNADVNSRIPGGWSALHLAVCLDNLAITTLLVQNGADINASSYEGNGWATVNKDLAFGTKGSVSFMRSPCPNGLRGGCWKPLHIASVAGNEPIVRLLVEKGAMPHSKDLEGCTAIQRAIMNGHAHLVQVMVEQSKQTGSSAPQAIQSGEATATRKSATGSNPDSVYQNLLGEKCSSGEGRTALHDGVQAGNETIVKFLLQNGWNPNSREPGSMWTPLSYAVAQEDRALTRLLLKHRADPRSVHADGSTSLHIAAEGEKIQILRDILSLCSVTLRDSHGATPLHYAARKGFAATTKLLLKSKLHVDLCDMANQTALFVAIGNANLPVAQLLLDYGAVTNIEDNSRRNLLHAAASSGSPSVLELVALRGKFQSLPLEAMDIHGRTPLQVAAEKHDVKMVQVLLQLHRPRDLWRPILSVLFAAAATGNDAVLHTILDYNIKLISALGGDPETAQIANINGVSVVPKKSWTLLHAAAWSGQTSTVRSLLQRGVSVNTETDFSLTPLGLIAVVPHDQLLQQHLTIAALLISHGGDIFKGGFGNTPLHLAALAGHNGLVTILLSQGASVAWENWEGELALHCAVHSGHSSVASTLIEHGSNANQLSKRNLPPLHEAVLAGNLEMAKGLVTAGINTDLFAPDGITALHVASSAGKIEIIRHLLNNGTGLEWRTTAGGLSPLDVAASNGQLEAVKTIMDSPPYKSTHHSDTTYAWIAASKAAAFQPKICKYIYERTNCQRDLGAGILHWAIAQDSRSLVAFLVDIRVDFRTPNSDGWSALHTAAMKGRISIARAILDEGFDVNYKTHLSRTALHQAVAADQAEAVSFLLSNGADINIRDENSQLPIHIAIDYGALNALRALPLTADDFNRNDFNDKSLIKLAVDSGDGALLRTLLQIENSLGPGHTGSLSHVVGTHDTHLIRQLLDHGAELNTRDQKGFSPLREAVVKRNLEAAALLVERGADLESKCSLGITPLAFAAKSNDLEMARLLIRHGANLNATETVNGCPILIAAAECGHVDMVDLMIQSGCDVHCRTLEGNTALHVAAQKRQPEVIRSLIQGGLPIDVGGKENQSALYCASRLGLSNIASMLIDLGADVNRVTDSGFAPLHDVAESDKVVVMYVLLKHGANINCADSSGRTPVMMAASGGSESTFRMLRAHGAELNIVSDLGWTILHFAARGGCVGIAKLLVEDGYDLNTKELGLGHTPLLTAARHGHLDFIRYLAEEGANMYATSSRGENAVHIACPGGETKHIAVVKLLIDLGLVCDQASDSGHTPLMLAAEHKNLALVTMLVEHGAKLDIITESGYGPLHAAAQEGNVRVLDFLLEHGLQLSDARAGPSQDTVIHIAAAEGHEDMVEAIAKRLPSLLTLTNQENFNPLQLALRRHRFGSMKKLHELGADINVESPKQRQTLIHLASKLEKPDHLSDIMGYLLQEGVSLESVTSDGFTPLKLAASLDRLNAAAALLDHGADIESSAGKEGRALDIAVKNGSSRVVELLVSKGACTSHLNYQGETLLYCAVCAGNVEVVKSLLKRNTGLINSLSIGGKWAPLHSAVTNNNVDIIRLLLENGASATVAGCGNNTPLHIAAEKGHCDAARALFRGIVYIDVDAQNKFGETPMITAAREGNVEFVRCLMEYREHLGVPSRQWETAAARAADNGHFETVEFFIQQQQGRSR